MEIEDLYQFGGRKDAFRVFLNKIIIKLSFKELVKYKRKKNGRKIESRNYWYFILLE